MSDSATICYDLHFPGHAQNLVDVTATLPVHKPAGAGAGYNVDVYMPVWTPGSYMVREYARHVQDVRARGQDGTPLEVYKTEKNVWRISAAQPTVITLNYQVWGRELTVRSNCIEQDFALLQGAATFLSPKSAHASPHRVCVHLPEAFTAVVSGLDVQKHGETYVIEAVDFDGLVDSPIVLGRPDLQHFEVDGVPHALATFGAEGVFDGQRAARDFKSIVYVSKKIFGSLPYKRYVMINLLYGGQGGLEHKDCAVIMASPWAMRSASSYRSFLGLVAHEHFHAWNIKRLRPKALGPFDYSAENHTRSLWIAEGITAFYDNLVVVRAGLCTPKAYLEGLAQDLTTLMMTPGRLKQTLAESSFDAWIKFYRRDENTDNTAVSYYLKGSLVGMLLNGALIAASNNTTTLDDVMRLAFERYSGPSGFEEAQFRACVQDTCPSLPESFLSDAVDTTKELSLTALCDTFGLEKTWHHKDAGPGKPAVAIELGLVVKDDLGKLLVTQVVQGAAAGQAGLQADDELIAIDGHRINAATWPLWLQVAQPEVASTWLVSRHGLVRQLTVTASKALPRVLKLALSDAPSPAQVQARALWFGPAPKTLAARG